MNSNIFPAWAKGGILDPSWTGGLMSWQIFDPLQGPDEWVVQIIDNGTPGNANLSCAFGDASTGNNFGQVSFSLGPSTEFIFASGFGFCLSTDQGETLSPLIDTNGYITSTGLSVNGVALSLSQPTPLPCPSGTVGAIATWVNTTLMPLLQAAGIIAS